MFAGGGFNGGAGDQFAGGGFMPSQANDTGYGGGGGSGGGKKGDVSLRTLTIRQLAKDANHPDDDNHMVDGVDLSNFAVVGKIVDVQDKGSHMQFTLNDGTGDLEGTYWLPEENENGLQVRKASLRRGVYVKAHGHLKLFDKKLTMSAFNVRVITNFNEVTYHFLRAIFEHLHLTKGGAGQQGGPAAGGFGAPAGGGWGAGGQQQQPQQQQAMPGAATAFAGAGGANDGCAGAVMQVLQTSNDDNGLHVEQIFNQVSGQGFNRAQVEGALQSLMNEAHVYNTVDDFHFKST